jgi:heterodisulfide reductase subunit D
MSKFDLSHYSFKQLMELDACTRCGECVKWCPTYAEKGEEPLQPAEKIRRMRSFIAGQYGLRARLFGPRLPADKALEEYSGGVYDCTLCGRCNAVCPVRIDTRPLWVAMREQLVELGPYPELFDSLRETVTTKYNISGDSNEDRLIWSENLEQVPEGVKGKEEAEMVYFVGCTPSFYPQTYGIPQATVEVMQRAGLDFATLGGEEWCCGYPLIIAGMGDAVKELVEHNVEAVRRKGARKLVAGCPSCYHTWLHEYPKILGEPLGFEVQHLTQLLEELIARGRLKLGEFNRPVTYHDPCDLGRNGGIYDAPRNVVRSIPGISFTEMEENRQYALCCGGGGDVAMVDPELVDAVARKRVLQAQATEAQVLLSACQQCKRTLMGALRQEKVRMQVLDVVELVARVMEA